MLTVIELFVALVILIYLLGITNALFFIKFVFKGMVKPSQTNLEKMNKILMLQKHPSFFITIFQFILFGQIRKFLRKALKKDKFIVAVNLLLRSVYKYELDRTSINKRMGRILERYDKIFYRKLSNYKSPKPVPLIDFLRSVLILSKNPDFNFNLTLKAGLDILLITFGNPFVKPKMEKYRVSKEIIQEFEPLLGSKKQFLDMLNNMAA